jgi:hypothetical protein
LKQILYGVYRPREYMHPGLTRRRICRPVYIEAAPPVHGVTLSKQRYGDQGNIES